MKQTRPGKNSLRPLADLVRLALDPVVARRGFGETSVLLRWEDIVGAPIAQMCEPIKMQWPRGVRIKTASNSSAQQQATLALRVEPGFSLEIQHMHEVIIGRINTHLGWRCVGRLSLKQEALTRTAKVQRIRPQLRQDENLEVAQATSEIADTALRDALRQLGARVFAKPR